MSGMGQGIFPGDFCMVQFHPQNTRCVKKPSVYRIYARKKDRRLRYFNLCVCTSRMCLMAKDAQNGRLCTHPSGRGHAGSGATRKTPRVCRLLPVYQLYRWSFGHAFGKMSSQQYPTKIRISLAGRCGLLWGLIQRQSQVCDVLTLSYSGVVFL